MDRLHQRSTPPVVRRAPPSSAASMSRAPTPLLSSAKTTKRFVSVLLGLLAISLLTTIFAGISLHSYIHTNTADNLFHQYHHHPNNNIDVVAAAAPNKLLKDLQQFQQPLRSRPVVATIPKKENIRRSSSSTDNHNKNNTITASTVSHYVRQPKMHQFVVQSSNSHYIQLSPANNDTSNNNDRPWSWPIIHTVSTRFMQNQGSLQNLARSRLKLLEAVCLPSLQHQSIFYQNKLLELYENTKWKDEVSSMIQRTTSNTSSVVVDPLFLWIIKVDPDIDRQILKELNGILEPVKHFTLVVGSNNNFGVGIKNGGWRDGQAGEDLLDAFQDNRVFFPELAGHDESLGSNMHQIIRRAYEARDDRVVLETRLDADDAINVEYITQLQRVALKNLIDTKDSKFVRKPNDDDDDSTPEEAIQKAKWMYWCAEKHLEWNPSSPFYNPNNDAGLITRFGQFNYCITPGLTVGYAVGTEEKGVPHYEHTKIYPEIALKSDHQRKKDGDVGCGFTPASECLWIVNNPAISAFRSRSMTSAGMFNIEAAGVPSREDKRNLEYSMKLWQEGYIQKWFGISSAKAKEAADFMGGNYINTVRDNIRGQCTHGHSCKISSVEKLQRTIDLSEEGAGGIDISST
jgi:hypothetical protein